uniref:Indoleamine 2,3-dioxygenase n=1 Tax=Yamagishiella unicocca TaxID=51707 RepID=A0A1W6R6M8_9CHLO|nr:indoleamine 2,3-dioxygenase [Yamagishiella unicocca]
MVVAMTSCSHALRGHSSACGRPSRPVTGRRQRCSAALLVKCSIASSPFGLVTKERGFLPSVDPLRRLALMQHDAAAAEWEAALADLPKLAVAAGGAQAGDSGPTRGGVLRRALRALPPFPLDKLPLPRPDEPAGESALASVDGASGAEAAELWRAYLLLSFLAHAYVWCEPGPPPSSLPAVLAVPWVRVAAAVGMPPVLTYATYNLYNWRRLDPAGPLHLGNIVCLQNFLGGPDEEWFRLVHVDIEGRAGPAVAGLEAMQSAAAADDPAAVVAGLTDVAAALRDMQNTLSRMGEKCDPYIYYQRVRTPMSGWRNNPDLPQGLIYEGVSTEPMQLYGETGAQSSVLHAFDAGLGVQHDQVWLREYLGAMVQHMPPPHRAFLARLAAANGGASNVRSYVMSHGGGAGGELRDAYNAAVEEMEKFRSQHKAFAFNYIAKWAKREATGTGGSDFMPALAGYRDTTSRHLLG